MRNAEKGGGGCHCLSWERLIADFGLDVTGGEGCQSDPIGLGSKYYMCFDGTGKNI